jgi:hypothetical protein
MFMDMSQDRIVQIVDAHLAAHPNAALPTVAEKLQVTCQAIEEALNKIEGSTFREFQSNKRLVQAFRQLGEMSPAVNGPCETKRVRQRFIIPKVSVRYRFPGFWRRKREFSNQCPLVDIGRDGLAFLSDNSASPNKRISLILKFPGEEALQVHGRVAYAIATGIAGYRYRIGIEFFAFADKRGCNTPASLDVLARLEETFSI